MMRLREEGANDKTKVLTGSGSLLLDGLRILAATTVVVCHGVDQWLITNEDKIPVSGKLAHAAVVLFFVLSGFVIAYTTKNRNKGPKQYAVARLTRLVSIVLPAILLTGIIQLVLLNINSQLYHEYTRSPNAVRYLLSATFLNESWLLSAAPPLNRPLWSLSFEFWYYVIFGAFIFRKTIRFGVFFFALSILVAGPKILLMMPIWLAGCVAYLLPSPSIGKKTAWLSVILLLIGAVIVSILVPAFPKEIGTEPFYFGNQFVSDYAAGVLISLALWILPLCGQARIYNSSTVNNFRKIADLTFPIYVLHHPLLVLFRAIFGNEKQNITQMTVAVISVIVVSSAMGIILEKYRDKWKRIFQVLISWASSLLGKRTLVSKS